MRYLFDEHVNSPAITLLRAAGIDVISVSELGLMATPDAALLIYATNEDRVIVTRNYRDFVPLIGDMMPRYSHFAGVLFLATSIQQADVGAHVQALTAWDTRAAAPGWNVVPGGMQWLK